MHQGFLVFDRELRVVAFTEKIDDLLGFSPGFTRVGSTAFDLVAEAHALGLYGDITLKQAYDAWLARFRAGTSQSVETPLADGRTMLIACVPVQDGAWVMTYEDATQRLETARALATQNELFNAALANMTHGLCMFDAADRLILCNAAYARLYDLPGDITGPGTARGDIIDFRASVGNAPVDMSTYFDLINEARETGTFAGRRVLLQDGRTIQITHNPMANGGYVATHEDVTAAIRAEAEIRYLATYDPLTGLPNRAALRERLAQALASARGNKQIAVHWLDLDRFKLVNDSLGHPAGDLLLKAATQRFLASVRDSDTVARLGGDEFIVIQGGIDHAEDAAGLARRLVERVGEPFRIDRHCVNVGVSIGVALCPRDGTNVDDVLRNADLALYRAKSDGRNTFRLFEAAMEAPVQARRRLELDLGTALKDGGLALHYQPQIDAKTGTVMGFEALLRWNHREWGSIPPLDFIPLAEESGHIVALGEWVLRQACRDAATWPAPIGVAVNLSPRQFEGSGIVNIVRSAMTSAGLEPSRLELEITESLLLVENETTLSTLHQLRKLGVRIALDDFGTGYSSLSYLRSFPFTKIKIDRSFIRDLGAKSDSDAIVNAIAKLAGSLGMVTTAEGVETEDQWRLVREHGCKEAQGFIFSRPRPAEEIAALLAGAPFLAMDGKAEAPGV